MPPSSKPSFTSPFTHKETPQLALLVQMVEAKSGFTLKGVTLPEGRTEKACIHVMTKLREALRNGGELPVVPKAIGSAKGKRKQVVDDGGEDDEESPSKKKAVRKRAPKAIKARESRVTEVKDEAEVADEVKVKDEEDGSDANGDEGV